MLLSLLLSVAEDLGEDEALLHLLLSIAELALETVVEVFPLVPKGSLRVEHSLQLLRALLPQDPLSK